MSASSPYWDTVMDMDSSTDVQYGKRLLPVMIDEMADESPDRVCLSFPRSRDLRAGFYDISYRTLANAINKTARFIEREIGRSSMFETVMYMGHPDVRQFIALFALMKTGHKVLLSSQQNSVACHANVTKQTDCGILLYTGGSQVAEIIEASRMESLCMPELDELVDDSIHSEPYPYTKSFEQAKHHPCMVVITSDLTRTLKPMVWTHGMLATIDAQHLVPDLDGRPTIWAKLFGSSKRSFFGLPLACSTGIVATLNAMIFNACTVVLGPSSVPTIQSFEQVVARGHVDAAILPPSTLEAIANYPTGLGLLDGMKFVAFTEGALSSRTGDVISRRTHLYSLMPNSEFGTVIQHAPDREDWQYVCINPRYSGIGWHPQGPHYELVLKKSDELTDVQSMFQSSVKSEKCSTSDLYSKHFTKPDHWKFEGRAK